MLHRAVGVHRGWARGVAAAVGLTLVVGLGAGCGTQAQGGRAAGQQESKQASVDAAVRSLVDAGAVAAVAQVRDGDATIEAAAGSTSTGGSEPAQADQPVRIASVTKSMVAVVVLQLVNEGLLTLDDVVQDRLPGVLTAAPEPIRLATLLDHTSGVPNYLDAVDRNSVASIVRGANEKFTDAQLVAASQTLPWGKIGSFGYSNTNYVLAGMIIEKVTGRDVAENLRERLFTPLEMTSTTYPTTATMPAHGLSGYLLDGDERTDVTDYDPSLWSSSGAVVSTVGDLNVFFRALWQGRVVPAALVEQMRKTGRSSYGDGILARADACQAIPFVGLRKVYGQRGNGFGYKTMAFSSPDGVRQVTLAWTTTAADPADDSLEKVAQAALDAGLKTTC